MRKETEHLHNLRKFIIFKVELRIATDLFTQICETKKELWLNKICVFSIYFVNYFNIFSILAFEKVLRGKYTKKKYSNQ